MKYITGQFALNIDNSLDTCGDWHASALNWDNIVLFESKGSIWGDFGIEGPKSIPEHSEKYYVADDIRAVLDLLSLGRTDIVQGLRDELICNDKYTELIMSQVALLKNSEHWGKIDALMRNEYYQDWEKYKKRHGLEK